MQTIFRAISLASFVMSASIIGGGAYVYFQREAILENVKAQVTAHATEAITEALPGLIDAYATAKMSGNETLIKLAIGPLQEFLGAWDLVPAVASEETDEE